VQRRGAGPISRIRKVVQDVDFAREPPECAKCRSENSVGEDLRRPRSSDGGGAERSAVCVARAARSAERASSYRSPQGLGVEEWRAQRGERHGDGSALPRSAVQLEQQEIAADRAAHEDVVAVGREPAPVRGQPTLRSARGRARTLGSSTSPPVASVTSLASTSQASFGMPCERARGGTSPPRAVPASRVSRADRRLRERACRAACSSARPRAPARGPPGGSG
jgi:hypothetical protein